MTGARIISRRRRRMREVRDKLLQYTRRSQVNDDNFMSEFLRDQARIANIEDIRRRLAEAIARGEK